MLFRLTIPPRPRPQNLALNVAEKGFKISVYNRSGDKTDNAVARAQKEGLGDNLVGFKDLGEFVQSLAKPRCVIILVKAGAPVDATIEGLSQHMEPGDIIIDGGNEWYENTERRAKALEEKGLLYMGMGVSGGEEGARNGPSMMPGGAKAAFDVIEPIITKVCAQTDSGPCTTYVGPGGSGNFVKMVHNGIEYGDMQLIAECYDQVVNNVAKLHYMFDGQFKAPLVIRTACGGGFGGGPHHSQSVEGWFLNVPGIVGLGKACEIALNEMSDEAVRLAKLRDKLEQGVTGQLDTVQVNGHAEKRLPHLTNISFGFVEGESLMMGIKQIACSSGSACTSASLEPSYVLKGLGLGDDLAHSSLRLSLGRFSTEAEVDEAIEGIVKAVEHLRRLSPLYDLHNEGIDINTIEWQTH